MKSYKKFRITVYDLPDTKIEADYFSVSNEGTLHIIKDGIDVAIFARGCWNAVITVE